MVESNEVEVRDSIFSAKKGDERRALNKIEIISIRILERWDEAINTFQLWKENKVANTSRIETLENKVISILYSIFIMNERLFNRMLKKQEYENLKKIIKKQNDVSSTDLEESFDIMNKVFDELGLIRVDTEFKKQTLEEINRKKGFD